MLSNIGSANDANEVYGSSYYKKASTTKKKSTEKPGASHTRQQPTQRHDDSHISSEARRSPRVGAPGGRLEGFGRNFGRANSAPTSPRNTQGGPGAQTPNAPASGSWPGHIQLLT